MKKYIVTLIPLILGMGCLISYNILSAESAVVANGVLVEPFYLLPMGYAFLTISIISFVISKFKKVKQ